MQKETERKTIFFERQGKAGPSRRGRLLVFIVAYNAEQTIEDVLKRIPGHLADNYEVEILIIDDASQDKTFRCSELTRRAGLVPFKITVLFNPVNQGYGGNQKIGFHYAIANSFDWVALVHGDGQYAPECLPKLVKPLAEGEAEAVFGSRMLEGFSALKGGMPLYKFAGNKVLTWFQNRMLGSSLSEFHSGYRLYSTSALAGVPFALNSNDFHFDTEIIIQFVIAGYRIRELPIPTFYGDEICHVNGIAYAWNVFKVTTQSQVQRYHIFYDRKFDCAPESADQERIYSKNAEDLIVQVLPAASKILILGESSESLRLRLLEKGSEVVIDGKSLLNEECKNFDSFDYLILLDDTDLARQPEKMLSRLSEKCRYCPEIEIILAVGNIAFLLTRITLLFGRFSYTRKGIINLRHFRLFTLRSIKRLFSQNNFTVSEVHGLAIPYHLVFSSSWLAELFSSLHGFFIRLRPSLFSYQLLIMVKPQPSLEYLLASAMRFSKKRVVEQLGEEEDE